MNKYEPQTYWEQRGQDYVVHSDWDSRHEFPAMLQYFRQYVSPQSTILEVGPGAGRVAAELQAEYILTLCDFVESFRDACEMQIGVRPDVWDGKTLPYHDKSFDCVLLFSVLLHVPPEDITPFLQEMQRVSRQYLYIATYTGEGHQLAAHVFRHAYQILFAEQNLCCLSEKTFNNNKRTHWMLQL